jgi:hypothetical protein
MPVPIDQMPIGEGRNPDGSPGASFFIDKAELEIIRRDGPEWKFEDLRFIPEAILEPDAIFEGLLRPGQEKSLCYSVRPTRDPDTNEEGLPRYGSAFVVFARVGIGGFVVFDWEWREEDPQAPGHPMDWESSFERATWRKT